MESNRDVSRRTFIQRLGVLGAAGLGAGSLLTACDSSGSNEDVSVTQVFEVTVQEFGSSYPYSGQNNIGVAFAINGEVGQTITLERGNTYEFALQGSADEGPNGFSHPFYVANTAEGAGGDEFNGGVENTKSLTGSVFFTPPSSAPDTLFYQCDNHVYMGGQMEIVDSS